MVLGLVAKVVRRDRFWHGTCEGSGDLGGFPVLLILSRQKGQHSLVAPQVRTFATRIQERAEEAHAPNDPGSKEAQRKDPIVKM